MDIEDDYLDAEETVIGMIALRRRALPNEPTSWVTEVTLDNRFLMSSHNCASERELARRAIDAVPGDALDVLVGGLGLGHTAHAALASSRVARVEVVELLPPVIRWLDKGMIPLAPELRDPRLVVVEGDVYARLAGPPDRRYDVIVIDVDNSPVDPLGHGPNSFYTRAALRKAKAHLVPGGVLGVWSTAPNEKFVASLRAVFHDVSEEPVSHNDVMDGYDYTYWVSFGRRPRGRSPRHPAAQRR